MSGADFYAWCGADGRVGKGFLAAAQRAAACHALVFCRGPRGVVTKDLDLRCMQGYSRKTRTLFVPGVAGAGSQNEAMTALLAFNKSAQSQAPAGVTYGDVLPW